MVVDANQAAIERLTAALENGSLGSWTSAEFELAADDFVEDWPQSGERIRGRANAKAINDNYPAMTGSEPRMHIRRVSGEGAHWVVEATIDYGDGIPVSYVRIADLRDGKIARITEYFASPFEAPAWRSEWVEHTL